MEENEVKGISLWSDAWNRLTKNKMAMAGGIILIFFVIVAILADVLAPYSYETTDMPNQYLPPSFNKMVSYNKVIEVLADNKLLKRKNISIIMNEVNQKRNDDKILISDYKTIDVLIEMGRLKEEDRDKSNEIVTKLLDETPFPHIFGTDSLGRDLFSRIIYGSRISLAVGFLTALVSLVIGVTFGAIAGFLGGRADNWMMRFVDVLYGMPYMFFVILLMVIFGRNFYMLFIGIGSVSWMTLARITRGQIISLRNNEYVEAARSIGASTSRLIFGHLLPNAIGPIIVYITLTIPRVMLQEAFLSFLGLGVQPPMTSWGLLASEGKDAIITYPWLILFPGIVLALVLFFLNFLGEGLRDALDPSMKNKV